MDNTILKKVYDKQKKIYNRDINNKLLYEKYEKKANDETFKYIRNNILSHTEIFKFAQKDAYMTITSKYAFEPKNIALKMRNSKIQIEQHLTKFTEAFFAEP